MQKQSWKKQGSFVKSGLISVMLTLLCLLSGCGAWGGVGGGRGFGGGGVGVFFGVYADPNESPLKTKRFIAHLQQSLQAQGFELRPLRDKHIIGFTARQYLGPGEISSAEIVPQDLASILNRTSFRRMPETRRVRVNTVLDLNALGTADAEADSSVHCTLKMDFVQPPVASNADHIENQGKTLEWTFKAATAKPIAIDFAS